MVWRALESAEREWWVSEVFLKLHAWSLELGDAKSRCQDPLEPEHFTFGQHAEYLGLTWKRLRSCAVVTY